MDADTPEDLQRLQHAPGPHLGAQLDMRSRPWPDILLSEQGLAHGHLVGRTAIALAQALNDQGCRLDMDLIYGGGAAP